MAQIINLPATRLFQLNIQLEGVTPFVWRKLLVPESIRLLKLHRVIQQAMGWLDLHLHEFDIHGVRYGQPRPDWDFGGTAIVTEKGKHLKQCLKGSQTFRYIYDFGDDWSHQITVEQTIPSDTTLKHPLCLAGSGACPPEDVGGVPGYRYFLKALAHPDDPEFQELLSWERAAGFDPTHFDLAEANARLALIRL